MAADTKTNNRHPENIKPHKNPLFEKLPEEYYHYALQWFAYPRWTIDEAANLLTGCVPHREMFLRGDLHHALDDEVLENENRIRAALGKGLRVVESKKYFAQTYIDASNVLSWAHESGMVIPDELIRAQRESQLHREMHGYTTPCMQALQWVVDHFWQNADLRDPPTSGEIIHAMLQEFPDLSPHECEIVEQVARHPAAKSTPD